MYLYSVIPSTPFLDGRILGTRANKQLDLSTDFTTLPPHKRGSPFPRSLRISTLDLASSNLVCSVALTGVLILQAGRWWAERADSDDELEVKTVTEQDNENEKRRRRKEKAAGHEKNPKRLHRRKVQS
jgi:hypothetical protein